jgi:proton-coupled amino acid transporter
MKSFPKSICVNADEVEPLIGDEKNDIQTADKGSSAPGGGTNVVATFFNFAKASVGSGSFALPFAIYSAGVVIGSLGMILLGVISVYTMQLMLECKDKATQGLSPEEKKEFNYTQVGRRALGFFGKWAVDISVLLCNLGVCAGYMIFIASNLQWAFTCFAYHHETCDGYCFNSYLIYAMILPILISLTYLPSFKYLAYAAYVGALFLVIAMIVVLVYGQYGFIRGDQVQLMPNGWEGLGQWFGLTAFLFCVHTCSMVIPLESTMKHPRYMQYVLDMAALVVVGVNLPFALYGYFLFGSGIKGYIFENISGGPFNDAVRIFLSLELTLTFPIVFKPASDVMEEIIQNIFMFFGKKFNIEWIFDFYAKKAMKWKIIHYVMVCFVRTLLVLVSWGIAIGIPRFELCLAFVGSFATTILAFILPPLFHLSLYGFNGTLNMKFCSKSALLENFRWLWINMRNFLHIILLVLGIIATVLATGINLYEAIAHNSPPTNCTSIQSSCVANVTGCN